MAFNRQYSNFLLGLFLLTVGYTSGASDVKTRIGEDFGVALRKYTAELINSNMDGLAEFYQTLLNDLDPTTRQERAFKLRLDTIKIMKERVGDEITAESLLASTNFGKVILMEIIMFQGTQEIAGDPGKLKIIHDALQKCSNEEIKSFKNFIEKVHTKWMELYETISEDELKMHPEYEDIKNQLEEILNSDTEKLVLERADMISTFMKTVSDFFGYKEYSGLTTKRKV